MTPAERIVDVAIELHLAKLERRELYRLAGTCSKPEVCPLLRRSLR